MKKYLVKLTLVLMLMAMGEIMCECGPSEKPIPPAINPNQPSTVQ